MLRVTGLSAGNSPVTGKFPAKGLVTRKMFPFDDVIMSIIVWAHSEKTREMGAVSIRKAVLPGMVIPMLKIRRPNGRLIFNMEIAIR